MNQMVSSKASRKSFSDRMVEKEKMDKIKNIQKEMVEERKTEKRVNPYPRAALMLGWLCLILVVFAGIGVESKAKEGAEGEKPACFGDLSANQGREQDQEDGQEAAQDGHEGGFGPNQGQQATQRRPQDKR
jgi:hypothetical protein